MPCRIWRGFDSAVDLSGGRPAAVQTAPLTVPPRERVFNSRGGSHIGKKGKGPPLSDKQLNEKMSGSHQEEATRDFTQVQSQYQEKIQEEAIKLDLDPKLGPAVKLTRAIKAQTCLSTPIPIRINWTATSSGHQDPDPTGKEGLSVSSPMK